MAGRGLLAMTDNRYCIGVYGQWAIGEFYQRVRRFRFTFVGVGDCEGDVWLEGYLSFVISVSVPT